ncbi:L-aspartate oxidase [hydrothermal vent metagenome]|uniref:L-aspartate oxidase n=1 Tax=hydrothermal vent metagenome TaxID=652676 RepID=A0A1W1BJD5_9ZZZZ
MTTKIKNEFDVLIVGSGIAGLMSALRLSKKLNIAIIAKKKLTESSSFFAQGGISAVLDKADSFEKHTQDTLKTAQKLGNEKNIRFIVKKAPKVIQYLEEYGVNWTKKTPNYHLTKEGGHSERRVIHCDDKTGENIQNTLISQIKNATNITIFEKNIAVDLIINNQQCIGAYVLNIQTNQVNTYLATQTILATGGASKTYLYTSNPDTSTGDGIAMAYRAGCPIVNMEFTQFHPTCLYHPQAKSFLISEALRGEGAKLIHKNGIRFMQNYDKRLELAPRDIVSRAIDNEMKTKGLDCVYLDISFKSNSWIEKHFPNILKKCLEFNIDIRKQAIPIVPAAHYTCGGVKTNVIGQTNLSNLYVLGESASTGMHGANRLASNSLLECLVMANENSQYINQQNICPNNFKALNWDDSNVVLSQEKVVVQHLWDELRLIMWNFVGIVRNNKRLEYALKKVTEIQKEVDEYYRAYNITNDLIELRNLVQVSLLIITSAIQRKESRGLHYNSDYPNTLKTAQNTILQKNI